MRYVRMRSVHARARRDLLAVRSALDLFLGVMKHSETMRALSLFSGAGGLDLGFERAGFEHVASAAAPRTKTGGHGLPTP
jgi:hypothetical protein